MKNEELDAALVAWDSWRENNSGRGFESFAQQHKLSESVCVELQRILNFGNDIGKMADDFPDFNSDGDAHEGENDSSQYSTITKDWLTEELGDRFEIQSPLGVGGMGTVWLAEQIKPIRRKVAIKLIRNDLVSPATKKRFAFERQALASLTHQNIATVHEAGESHKGRSYFIMEYIPGAKITDFCNRRKLDLLERLRLFLQVCDGVQYAHRRGLVHRDLKPGNVIVMEENDVPVAKVIDFGLAKDTAKPIANESLTGNNAVLGSPAWMSPEQALVYVDGEKVEVDTRTDVYSLGSILYQLLTNSTPIPKKVIRESPPAQIFDAIRNQLPASPSKRLGERTEDSKSWLKDASDSSFSSWVSILKDDLDWVVMKAIEKDVSRRYESVGEFAGDIRRFIAGESVTARPPSKIYQFRKIVGRNRIWASSVVAIATTLIVATFISTFYAIKANRAQELAERRLKGSQQLTEVFASGFEVLSYFDDAVENTELKRKLLREVGRQMEAKAAAFPPDLPPIELAEREYLWRSKYIASLESAQMRKECIEQLDKVVKLFSPVVQKDDERLLDCRIKLADYLAELEEIPRAKQVAAENLEIVSQAFPKNHILSIRSEIVSVRTFIDDRTIEENETKFKELIERAGSLDMEDSVRHQIEIMKMAATHAFNAQERALGIGWLDKAQKLARKRLAKDNSLTIELEFEYWLQIAYSSSGQKVDVDLLEERIRSLSNSLGETHPTVIRYQTTLARILNVLCHFGVIPDDKALSLIRKTLASCTENLRVGHPLTSDARSELLRCLYGAGRMGELVEACETHVDLLKAHCGEKSELYRKAVSIHLAGLLLTKQYEIMAEKARLYQSPLEEASALIALERYPEAKSVCLKFIESKDPKTKVEFAEMVPPYMLLAEAEFRCDDFETANNHLYTADEFAEKVNPPNHKFRLEIKEDLMINYRKMGQSKLAIQKGKELLDILVNQGNTMPQKLRSTLYSNCLHNLVELYATEKEFQTAKQYASLYFDSPITHRAVSSQEYLFKALLGMCEFELGNDEEAKQNFLDALEAIKTSDSPKQHMLDRDRRELIESLKKIYRRQGNAEKLKELEQEDAKSP